MSEQQTSKQHTTEQQTGASGAGSSNPTAASGPLILDMEALLERVEGNTELVRELADLFLEHSPDLLAAIRDALDRGDAEELGRAAHSLKGAVRNLSGVAAGEVAQRLEVLGRDGDLEQGREVAALLEAEIERLKPALLALT